MKRNRRQFMRQSAMALAGASAGLKASAAWGRKLDRPNILVVLDDQERQAMHLPALHLPNRERLRRDGVEFTHAYCTYPLCSPSRATLMTGLYPHEVGIMTNVDFAARNPSLDPRLPNFGRVFSEAGYHTAYFGKWHLSRRAHSVGSLLRYGFRSPHVSNQLFALGSDPKVTEDAARWLRRSRDKAPWLLVFSPINPHDICLPFLDKYYHGPRDYDVSLPPNFSPERAAGIKTLQGHSEIKAVERMLPHDEESWLAYLRFYCCLIEDVDLHLGQVLDALAESGQESDTVIVFTSDHGEMGGAHGLCHKGPTMYEENMRIPLLISAPGRVAGFRQCDSLVCNLDLVPTLCSLAGVRWPQELPGLDLTPVLQSGAGIERECLFAEGSPRLSAVWRGVRTRELKYWHYTTGEELLFHIREDPWEMHNLAGDRNAEDVLTRLRHQVREWRKQTRDPVKDFME